MSFSTRRTVSVIAVALLVLSVAADPVFAQATVGPAGGVGSTTAPSNSQGTPAGGTGVISTTRVGPSGSVMAAPTQDTSPTATAPRTRRVRHRAHRARHHAAQVGTQSQAGTNGAAQTTR